MALSEEVMSDFYHTLSEGFSTSFELVEKTKRKMTLKQITFKRFLNESMNIYKYD